MQIPLVFYVVCLVAMTIGHVDSIQVTLAWLFVGLRAVHAFIMLAWNFVPYRFAASPRARVSRCTLSSHNP